MAGKEMSSTEKRPVNADIRQYNLPYRFTRADRQRKMLRRLSFLVKEQAAILYQDKLGMVWFVILAIFIVVAIVGPYLAPHGPLETLFRADGTMARMDPPSWQFPFGTDRLGRDIFSQVILGTRVAVIVGLSCALMVMFIGTNIGLISGYFGGRVDSLLMRFTDIVYGVPFLPFAVILVALMGPGLMNIILSIVFITWRVSARVIRAQVLTLKQRTFVEAARVSGASHFRIIYYHIAPNVLPLAIAYGSIAMGWAITAEAEISFLGYGDPRLPSWGKIIFMCYISQAIGAAWWWILFPGLAIMLLVLSGFGIGRAYEEVVNPRLRKK